VKARPAFTLHNIQGAQRSGRAAGMGPDLWCHHVLQGTRLPCQPDHAPARASIAPAARRACPEGVHAMPQEVAHLVSGLVASLFSRHRKPDR